MPAPRAPFAARRRNRTPAAGLLLVVLAFAGLLFFASVAGACGARPPASDPTLPLPAPL